MYLVDDMAVFVSVVDCESFTMAGRELRLTTAVVSSRIARLENRLGVRLLNRTTRTVSPTEEGRVYYEHARRILDEAERAEQLLAELQSRPAGALRVSTPTAFGRNHIAPLIPGFVEANEKVQLRLQMTDRLVDLLDENVDLAIRQSASPSSSLMKRRIAPDLRVVCAAPSYFERHGVPKAPDELQNHKCLLLRFPGSMRYFWTFESPKGESFKIRMVGAFDANASDVLIDWALEGHGLVMTSVWDLAPHLRERRLLGVLPQFWPRDLDVYALMPPRRRQPTKTRAFVDYLLDRFAEHPDRDLTERANVPLAEGAEPAV